MRRVVLIVPGWVGSPGDESVLHQNLPALNTLAERGRMFKLAPVPAVETPEAAWLGIDPSTLDLREGPLTVAAFGADPPERSVQFHLSLMSHEDGTARALEHGIPADQVRILLENARRLNTARLTIVPGEGADHGLVWENGSLDLMTHRPDAANGQPMKSYLPEGEGERGLRRLIDDSVDLLTALPFNEERMDQGLQPINLLWPWGQGFRTPAPNLWLQRGEQAWIESRSLRMQGLAKLVRYRHGDRGNFGRGVSVRLEGLRKSVEKHQLTIVVLDAMADFRGRSMLEEMSWLTHEIDRRLLQPLADLAAAEPTRVTVLSPGLGRDGLGISFESRSLAENSLPFDERSLEEKRLERRDVWQVVLEAIQTPAVRENIA